MSAESPLYGCSSIDNYELLDKLGEGTFGEVHKARHKPTGEAVALKEILLHKKDDGMPITALREIRILKSLRHANVIGVLDMAVKRGSRSQRRRASFSMVTPYMDHDLAGLFGNSDVKFKLAHIKCYMHQVLSGIGYLHAQNFMHRDVKAANILVDNHGRVKLADFGLARKFMEPPPGVDGTPPATHKYTPTVVTRWYRPPELLMGDLFYTPAIDVWGVGCVFGEFFRRKPILPGKSDEDQLVLVFKLVGSPTPERWTGWESLPGAKAVPSTPVAPTLDQVFNNVPEEARSLLAGLLCLDPLRRLTAEGALNHHFFTDDPPMAQPQDLPTYASSHELDARRRREHEAQNKAPPHPHPGQGPANLPSRPPRNGPNFRVKTLGFKIPNRKRLTGIDLVPPYRRNGHIVKSEQPQPGGLDY